MAFQFICSIEVSREICSTHENISISLEAFREFIERKGNRNGIF